jgi:hypothetical protein
MLHSDIISNYFLTKILQKKFGEIMTTETKKQIGLRIPQELDRRLEKHVNKIGISKPAFILGLIFKELEKNEPHNVNNKEND